MRRVLALGKKGGHLVEAVLLGGLTFFSPAFTTQVWAGSTYGPRIIAGQLDPPPSVRINETFTHQVLAEDPDGGKLTFALAFGPLAMSIDAQTGIIRWTPTADDGGGTFTVQVLDGFGHMTTETYAIIVTHPDSE